jgi:iron complex outermembrane receptor protein
MVRFIALLSLWIALTPAFGQVILRGVVQDATDGSALPGANVMVPGTRFGTVSDAEGRFSLRIEKSQPEWSIRVSYVGYQSSELRINPNATEEVVIQLQRSELLGQEVVVFATRAGERTPATFTTVDKKDIQKVNLGQDLPILLDQTPSVVVNSDAGAGIGYTGLRIRGSDGTRINVTINGIPVNDSESHGVFWVNMPDFATSVENIQIQRGVGTSTNGAAAFGASLNIQTDGINEESYAQIDNSFGSFNSWKHTVRLGSGLINDRFTFDARLSQISSDGFIDRARSDLNSFFLSGGYHGEKSLVKLLVFSGQEETYQAWEGIPESRLRGDAEGMQAYIARNGLNDQQAENLLNSDSRSYNIYEYPDQVDNYQQDHYQLHYALQATPDWVMNAALHFTRGRGYFEQFRFNDRLSNYGLSPIELGEESISRSDLVRRRWLDNWFYGTTFSASYLPDDKVDLTLGGAWNNYIGDHFGELIWGRFLGPEINPGDRYYDNEGSKRDMNVFAKLNYRPAERWEAYADVQWRGINYSFFGFNRNLSNITQEVDYSFFNPKAGITFSPTEGSLLYASYAIGNREPVRRDLTESTPESRPRPEQMQNVEMGYRKSGRNFQLTLNHFLMLYRDQLVLTGQVNDVGAYTRANVENSFRAGIELDGSVRLSQKWQLAANLAWSRNRIRDFVEFVDDFDAGGQQRIEHGDTDIAFSPNWVGGATLAYQPNPDTELAFVNKYVGRQYLDNTSNISRSLDDFFVQDFRASYRLRMKDIKGLRFNLMVNNLFDVAYEPNGYTFGYIFGGERIQENFYYPMAGRNFLLGLGLDF